MSTRAQLAQKSFHRLVFITRDDLLAARWWHEGMTGAVTVRPTAGPRSSTWLVLVASSVLAWCFALAAMP
jgi:hypothetical protein